MFIKKHFLFCWKLDVKQNNSWSGSCSHIHTLVHWIAIDQVILNKTRESKDRHHCTLLVLTWCNVKQRVIIANTKAILCQKIYYGLIFGLVSLKPFSNNLYQNIQIIFFFSNFKVDILIKVITLKIFRIN